LSPFTASTANDEAILRVVVMRLLNVGARAKGDTRWLVSALPADLLGFFRSEVSNAIREKAADPVKARKIFLSLGKTARIVFGPDYSRVKQEFDRASKAAAK
jgi:hypothetical protein